MESHGDGGGVMIEHALAYAARGWPVFPLRPGGKAPATTHGFKDATTDEDQITAWWIERPNANIGLATGYTFDVLDLDAAGADAELHAAWTDAGQPAGFLSGVGEHGPVVATPRGGLHLYVEATGAGNRAPFVRCPNGDPAADWRGRGGYVVAPPSVDHRGSWEWLAGPDAELPSVPAWLALLVAPPPIVPPSDPSKDRSASPDAIVAGLVRVVLGARDGERNDKLNWAAYRLRDHVAEGTVDARAGADALIDAGIRVGLGEREVVRTIASGLGVHP